MPKIESVARHAGLLWAGALASGAILVAGPFGMSRARSPMDLLFFFLVSVQALLAGVSFRKGRLRVESIEVLCAAVVVLFLFSYIFAMNANMDYVQRFAEGKTYLNFGPDSRTERLNAILRYGPILAVDMGLIVMLRRNGRTHAGAIERYAFLLTFLSAAFFAFSFPSFLSLGGLGPVAFVSVVPLFIVLRETEPRQAVFYGTFFGVLETMVTNYWLGTFSLVTLQAVSVIYALFFLLFMTVAVRIIRRYGDAGLFILPFAWVGFDFLRSSGFIGYPWGMIGTTQYRFLPFIQIAELTGVWGVTFVVLLVNASIAFLLLRRTARSARAGLLVAVVVAGIVVFGSIRIRAVDRRFVDADRVTVALVQQNTDPRKNDYRSTFEVLTRLTDRSLAADPALVVWSETAFVPNIRRWSQEDPRRFAYAALTRDFLDYQESIGVWLLTGNDDYERVTDSDGNEIDRLDYNAAVLFDDTGRRRRTYRKIHLVPITEYFPFKRQLPWAYEALKNFDVYLWEPGTERVVFEHPDFSFSTPICFEDSFPRDVRLFVRAGADLIINISNDYWSLREVEAQQHFSNALFRSIENRRVMLRAAASGVTSRVDPTGRLVASLPNYVEDVLLTDVPLATMPATLYTRLGDWFPLASLAVAVGALFGLWRRRGG